MNADPEHTSPDESPLEPNLPICDAHHHFWDRRYERAPFARYLLEELMADIDSGHNVRSTVFVECKAMYRADGPQEMRSVGELEFAQGLAAASASGLYGNCRAAAAIVGLADLTLGDQVAPVLDALQAASPNRFRGIRHAVLWDPHPDVDSRAPRQTLANDNFRAGARALARRRLSFDAWLNFPQLPDLAEFANAIPDLQIVLNHVGGLIRVGSYGNRDDEVLATWRSGLAAVAKCRNVTVKLGGLGMPRTGFGWHARARPVGSEELARSIAPFLTYCIDLFGPDRCMFESNFPVDKVSFSYTVIYNAFKRLSAAYSPAERTALFHDTAVRVYQINA